MRVGLGKFNTTYNSDFSTQYTLSRVGDSTVKDVYSISNLSDITK